MKWTKGRQSATHSLSKLTLWSKFSTDCHLIKIPSGAIIGAHFDNVDGKKHYRCNLTLKGKWVVIIDGVAKAQRFMSWHFFRPDIQLHSATVKTDALILSVGFVL